MMDRQVGHLTRLVDDLLDVSRITRGLVELRKEPVDLAAVADHAVEMPPRVIESRRHELTVALPRKPLRVEGDATRLTQVIFNMLNNAAKYTDPGGRIGLTVERDAGRAVVRVHDNGTGMKPDLVPRVFDLFTQGERTLDRSQGGLGLGLTLVRSLVRLHGGTVEAFSEGPGRGSEFVVTLPILDFGFRVLDCSAKVKAVGEPDPSGADNPKSKIQNPKSRRLLVVDDNRDSAETLADLARIWGFEVATAYDGLAALRRVEEWEPAWVFLDIGMPGLDGYEV